MDKNESIKNLQLVKNSFATLFLLGAHQEEVDGKVGYSSCKLVPMLREYHIWLADFITNWYENHPMALMSRSGGIT